MNRTFNTTGPCVPGEHYMLPPEDRCDVMPPIAGKHFFVIHAARQTGKTTLLNALERTLNAGDEYHALYCSLESVQGLTDPEKGIPAVVDALESMIYYHPRLKAHIPPRRGDFGTVVKSYLADLCAAADRPVVVFFDEADCLSGQTLITFLRQLRDGYVNRSRIPFVHSMALVGMRDIRDYKAQVRPDGDTLGSASPFNIVAESLTLSGFSRSGITTLYEQHTTDTGQAFPDAFVDRVHELTRGQPWLVNAIARETVLKRLAGDAGAPIVAAMADEAAQRLMLRRDTHIDSLLERLKEERVRRVMQPILLGEGEAIDRLGDDFLYARDLGLIRDERGTLRPANPIYAEVIARILNYNAQQNLSPDYENRWMDGERIDMQGLLEGFQDFWRENSEAWVERFQYKEAAPHLILMAFLQRVLNGGADLAREFATGTRRVDLCVTYAGRRYPIELKLVCNDRTRAEGLRQLSDYVDKLGAEEGWLVLFDQTAGKSWDERIYDEAEEHNGRILHILGA